jgi:hypothetical protein
MDMTGARTHSLQARVRHDVVDIIHATTGEIIRELTLNPAVDNHPAAFATPDQCRTEGSRFPVCLATSHAAPSRIRTCDTRFRNASASHCQDHR